MKRLLSVWIMILAVLLLFSGCEKSEPSTVLLLDAKTGKQILTLKLDIRYDPNAVLSVYDADIHVDEEYIGTIEQGFRFSETLKLDEGIHTIQFNKHGDPAVCVQTMVKLKEDSLLSCTLKGYLSEMEVSDEKLTPMHPESAAVTATADSMTAEPTSEAAAKPPATETETIVANNEPAQSPERTYILNTNTRRFHNPDCQSVKKMKDKNKQEFYGTREAAMDEGYQPCSQCQP